MIRNMVLKRIGSALLALLLSSVVIFLLVRLAPGDPINLVLGEGPGDIGVNTELLEERRESLREAHGLNDSIPVQYANWFKKIITLDMGTSIRSGRPITQELWSRVPATFTLALAALFIETILGVLFGIYSAVHAGKLQDRAIRLFCVILASLPAFVLSLLFLFLFAVRLHWYEISSQMEWGRLWLPAITLGIIGAPKMVLQGAFQNALLPAITTVALSFAHMIGGSVVIEAIFNWPGIGNYAINSILVHDYPAVQGYTVLTVATVILINLTVEITYILSNPMVRRGGISRPTAQQ